MDGHMEGYIGYLESRVQGSGLRVQGFSALGFRV